MEITYIVTGAASNARISRGAAVMVLTNKKYAQSTNIVL